MPARAEQKSAPFARRPLPRNLRKATLAARVGQRVAEKRPAPLVTPTPAPVAVELDDARTLPSLPEPVRLPRTLWLAVVLLCVLGMLAVRSSLRYLPLERTDMFAFAHGSKDWTPRGMGFLDALVEGRASAPAETTAEVVDEVPLRREGHVSIPGGILVLPTTFHPKQDGSYDLLIHFHGNTAVVRESAEVANLNAAVAIINLGIGSAPYEEYYGVPGTYEDLLASIDSGLKRRGLSNPRVQHIALSAWSAGYGSISTILQLRRGKDPLDAILILDGIHAGWEEGVLNHRQMKPFADAAARASRNEIYFGITHSAIDPKAYASTTATADYLLASLGLKASARDAERDAPTYLDLESMKGAVSKKLEKHMEPTREARSGAFHVLGYRGDTKEHHMAHLFQMGATLLPELVARWR